MINFTNSNSEETNKNMISAINFTEESKDTQRTVNMVVDRDKDFEFEMAPPVFETSIVTYNNPENNTVGFITFSDTTPNAGPQKPFNNPQNWVLPGIIREMTDSGNAELMKRVYSDEILYNQSSKLWHIWNGKCYAQDEENQIFKKAQQAIDKALYKLQFLNLDAKQKSDAEKYFKKCKNYERLKKMIELFKSEKGITVMQNMFNPDKDLLNVNNGVVNLRNGLLLPHDKKYLMNMCIDIDYNQDDWDNHAKRPVFMKFIKSVSSGIENIIQYQHVFAGYCLTGETKEQSMYFYMGKGSTGKSTLANVLRFVLGPYCKDAPQSAFTERNDSSNFELAYISDARLVLSSEESERCKLNEPLVKRITGGEEISCCHKYGNFFRYRPQYKVLTTTNEIPYIASQGYDMRRRIKVIPFNQRFKEGDPNFPLDKDLEEKLRKEASAILAWMVKGAILYYSYGFPYCEEIEESIDEVFKEQDPLYNWLNTYFEKDPNSYVSASDLWASYDRYCSNTNSKKTFQAQTGLSRALNKREDLEQRHIRNGNVYYGLKKKEFIYTYDYEEE